jgi:penicillin amidase
MWQELSTSFPQKLDREALSQHLPPDLLADLYPVGSWRDHPPTQQPTDLTSPRIVQQVPLDSTQSKLEVPQPTPPSANTHDLLAISHAFAPPHCNDCRSGSNNWVVSGSHSASGSPLISNDMHLALSAPDIWYEAALHAPSVAGGNTPLDVTGFTLPGVPSVLVGRNAHVAWTLTNLGGDIQDLWIEHLRGSGNEMQFEQPDGTWSSVQHHTEHIVVRGSRDVTLDILSVSHAVGSTTIETPIISRLYPTEHRALSLAWTIYDPSTLSTSLLAADASPDASSLVAAFATFGGPSLNLIYADDHGHIGYHALGRIPIRGPAVPHPRAVTPFVMPEPEPDSDEENDESQSAPAANHDSIAPTLFNPPSSQPSFSPRILLRETAYIPSTRRTRRSKIHPQQIEPQPSTPQSDQALPSPPIEQNFTIGSPLSPVPVDALNPTQQWSGYIPYDSLPAVQDPSDGILATANSRIVSDDYPYAIALSWVDPYRTERIYRLLEGRNNLTPQAMLAIQTDTHSEFDLLLAQRVAYAIDHASTLSHATNPARLRQAADILRNWQADLTPNSPAAAIVAAVHSALWSKLLIPQIIAHDHCSHSEAVKLSSLYLWGERTTALEQILTNDPARWLPATAPNWNNFLATVTDRALAAAHAPRDLSHWHYGILHTVAIDHPLFDSHSLFRWVLGVPTGSGSQPAAGDLTTIDAIGHTFGPSERLTADMSIPSATFANITTGQSGNPASPWFLDQFSSWLRGATYALPLNDTAAAHTLTLLPNS